MLFKKTIFHVEIKLDKMLINRIKNIINMGVKKINNNKGEKS